MEYIGSFTPQSVPAGTFNIQYRHGQFVFINESYANLLIKLDNGNSFALQSGQLRMVCVNQSSSLITYTTLSSMTASNAVDACYVEYYKPGEKSLERYPSSLARQSIVGNVVTTSGGSMANLINGGNPAGTQIVEATPAGDPSSAVSLTNDGIFTLGNATHAGSISVLGNATIGGTLLLDNSDPLKIKDMGGTGCNVLEVDGTNSTRLYAAATGGQCNIYDPTGGAIAGFKDSQSVASTIASTGALTVPKVFFNIGAIKDLATGTVSVTTTATVNHGLSGTPSCVLCVVSQSGSSATLSAYNYTSTQFTILNGSGIAMTVRWFAYR